MQHVSTGPQVNIIELIALYFLACFYLLSTGFGWSTQQPWIACRSWTWSCRRMCNFGIVLISYKLFCNNFVMFCVIWACKFSDYYIFFGIFYLLVIIFWLRDWANDCSIVFLQYIKWHARKQLSGNGYDNIIAITYLNCSQGGCRTGMAKVTNAYDLPARFVY